ncbi:hypothetical protein N5D52_28940 [Pseudomonas sp. GD03860]|uniref:toxin VasX n=1 Tax=Pseudomonas TaxID=286 RepID=UPI0023638A4E|nr:MULTISPECIES: toxin VasX [Pseudomonas]MDD2058965.1 hypothetical protein [Pseudomonas putida]MDD2061547.1 hypothetical protein [Pseudomonas putida]MDH0640955.1 hypothetical protein [Pseudomonas sp. GD03860]
MTTPIPHVSANTAAQAKNAKDVRSPLGVCPLMKTHLQLLPLRYGLVEQPDPAGELSMPFSLKSQPLGIRLLRDGYLYIINASKGVLHEYRIENGQITKLLWHGQEVSSDTRTTAVGEPHLVFNRKHTLYASYCELQWTAFKCAQVLGSSDQRQRLMQRVDLQQVCPEKGGAHLLSKAQADKWLAEVAKSALSTAPGGSNPLPDGTDPEEHMPYHWEHQPLFGATAIEALTSKVQGPYKDDYLFLVLHDDIGVMRDLAAAQLKVAHWLGQWSADDTRQVQYLSGSYIQSLYEVTGAQLEAMSETDKDIQALLDDTSDQQQAAIEKYLKVRRDCPDPGRFGSEAQWREAAQYNVFAKVYVGMKDALGDQLYQKHQHTLNTLNLHSHQVLNGAALGERGIDHLIDRAAMETFVSAQQTLLSHWHTRLRNIREDRLKLFTGGHFHRAAWYYDFTLDAQIQHRLETEFMCVAAMCADREATEKLAAYLEANLLTVVPGLDTLALAEHADVTKKLVDLSQLTVKAFEAPENLGNVSVLSNQFHTLMTQRLPNYARLSSQFMGLQSMLEQAYNPAHQLEAADQLEKAHDTFKRGQSVDPNDFIRHIGAPARLQLLRGFSREGLTLRAASATEIAAFNNAREQSMELRRQLKQLYKLRRTSLGRQHIGVEMPGNEEVYNRHIAQLKSALVPLEERLTGALTTGGHTPAQIGTVIEGMDWNLRVEMSNAARDFRATGTFTKPLSVAVQSKADGIAFALFVIQGRKFIEAMSAVDEKGTRSKGEWWAILDSFVGMSAAGFAAVQGLSVTLFQAHLGQMQSAAGKLNAMSRLGSWSGIAGLGAFGFGALAATIGFGKHSQQWGEALAAGNYKALGATTLQITGDGVLAGTSTWAAKHTGSIVKTVMRAPTELRALAWAEASPRLLGIAAHANLIGLIGTALQLTGEGLYNFFHRTPLQDWMHTSAWGKRSSRRSLQDEWSALAKITQQPTCELVRDDNKTYLKLVLPGVSTHEMDSRQVQLLAYQQGRYSRIFEPYNSRLRPLEWRESTAPWATSLVVASEGREALTLHLPIDNYFHEQPFALALTIAYQLDAEYRVIHPTCFVLRNLYVIPVRGGQIKVQGSFKVDAVDSMPVKTGQASFWLIKKDELVSP